MKKKLSLIKLNKLEVDKKALTSIRGGQYLTCDCLCCTVWGCYEDNEAKTADFAIPSGGYTC